MSTRTDWKAMQAAGARKPAFTAPSNIKPKYMAMGYWHADASKSGARRRKGGQG